MAEVIILRLEGTVAQPLSDISALFSPETLKIQHGVADSWYKLLTGGEGLTCETKGRVMATTKWAGGFATDPHEWTSGERKPESRGVARRFFLWLAGAGDYERRICALESEVVRLDLRGGKLAIGDTTTHG